MKKIEEMFALANAICVNSGIQAYVVIGDSRTGSVKHGWVGDQNYLRHPTALIEAFVSFARLESIEKELNDNEIISLSDGSVARDKNQEISVVVKNLGHVFNCLLSSIIIQDVLHTLKLNHVGYHIADQSKLPVLPKDVKIGQTNNADCSMFYYLGQSDTLDLVFKEFICDKNIPHIGLHYDFEFYYDPKGFIEFISSQFSPQLVNHIEIDRKKANSPNYGLSIKTGAGEIGVFVRQYNWNIFSELHQS